MAMFRGVTIRICDVVFTNWAAARPYKIYA